MDEGRAAGVVTGEVTGLVLRDGAEPGRLLLERALGELWDRRRERRVSPSESSRLTALSAGQRAYLRVEVDDGSHAGCRGRRGQHLRVGRAGGVGGRLTSRATGADGRRGDLGRDERGETGDGHCGGDW